MDDRSQSPNACEPSKKTTVPEPLEDPDLEKQSNPSVRRPNPASMQVRSHAIKPPKMTGKFAKEFLTRKEFFGDGYEIFIDYETPAYFSDAEPTAAVASSPVPVPRPMTGLALVNFKTSPEGTGAVEKRNSGHKHMDYYTSLDDSIELLKESAESSSPAKTFWEGTGAIPKYFTKDYKTPPKVLPPFHKPSPTKLKVKTESTEDVMARPKSVQSDRSSEPSSPESAEADEANKPSSPEPDHKASKQSGPHHAQSEEQREPSSPKSFLNVEISKPSTSKAVEPFCFVSEPDSLKSTELVHEAGATSSISQSALPKEEFNETSNLKSPEHVYDTNSPSKLKSAETESEMGATSMLESTEPGAESSPKSTQPQPTRNINIPKTRSDFEDDRQWVRYNCLDFQDYKRTVNNKQKGVEQSLNQVLPSMNRAMKDAQRLATKIDKVRSEVCDKEESLKIQNDKLKYLVGRSMSTLGKIDEVLDRFRTDILAYTTLTTEGNEGIDMRLNRLLKILCGLDDVQLGRERNALIREAFSEDVTKKSKDDSK